MGNRQSLQAQAMQGAVERNREDRPQMLLRLMISYSVIFDFPFRALAWNYLTTEIPQSRTFILSFGG